ncbi:MAG: hypothetical protein M5U15_13650 [Kiritimatiellae bacterium]|nr:hypothetical protein [Kiritimatiellia bacterium]
MIALYRGRSWVSRAIRWYTWGPYSHASYVAPDLAYEIESWGRGGVQLHDRIGAAHTDADVIDLYTVDVSAQQARVIEQFLREQVGRRYDWHSVFHFVLRRTEHVRDQQRWFCSELICAAYRAAGVELLARPCYSVSPSLLGSSPLLRFVSSGTRVNLDAIRRGESNA